MDGFQFEGRQQTARQLSRQYPALTVGRWQSVLEAGCKTWDEARLEAARLDYAMRAALGAAGRKAARMPQTRNMVVRRRRA